MVKVVIIGAGPAGSMAAIAASRAGAKVVLIDKNIEYGKKLSITGNGKCNYSNLTIPERLDYTNYSFDKTSICDDIIREYGHSWISEFFKAEGMLTATKGDLMYPRSEQSVSVINTLKQALLAEGIEIKNLEAKGISKSANGYSIICTNNTVINADRVVIATGGKAAPKTGSVGGGYKLARAMGHTVTFTYPGLCKLVFDKGKYKYLSNCAGTRAKVVIDAYLEGNKVGTEEGELQITESSLSGICVFNLSRFLSKAIEDKKSCHLEIDFAKGISIEELNDLFSKGEAAGKEVSSILMGIVPEKLAKNMSLEYKNKDKLLSALKGMSVEVIDHGSFDEAQVTIGGVVLDEINKNLESKITPGLFFAGEVLDVDAACGGYNLHWAFASGFKAGSCAAEG